MKRNMKMARSAWRSLQWLQIGSDGWPYGATRAIERWHERFKGRHVQNRRNT